jgi:hypothetical protein
MAKATNKFDCGVCCASQDSEEVIIVDSTCHREEGKNIPAVEGAQLSLSAPSAAPSQWVVCLEKAPGQIVGLYVDWGQKDKLRITRLNEDGILLKWNLENPSTAVQAGDYVVEVNGIRGNAKEIFETVKAATKFIMVVSRS